MPSHAQDWRNRAALARSFGDMPTADWCDEQADHHDRLAASAASLEDITDCLKGGPDHSGILPPEFYEPLLRLPIRTERQTLPMRYV